MELDLIEKQLLNEIQLNVPLSGRPFRDIGYKLLLDEDEVIRRVMYLKESGYLRWVGAIIDWRKLGFQSTLVGMRLPPDNLEKAADIINKHPGVSHNFSRSHDYNLWFTLTVPPAMELNSVVEELALQTEAQAILNLPAVKVFRIRAFFDVLGNNGNGIPGLTTECPPQDLRGWCLKEPSLVDMGILKELQNDMPVKRRPFDQMARRVDIYLDEFLTRSQELVQKGVIRRYSGLIHHLKAGFTYNAMSCWKVPPAKVDTFGARMIALPVITHCYERATNGDWPYNIFGMIHGRSCDECEKIAGEISRATGITDYLMLYSIREFKKERASWLA